LFAVLALAASQAIAARFAKFVREEMDTCGRVLRAAGVTPQ
jgi:hypothetical protein